MVLRAFTLALVSTLVGCTGAREAEDPTDWYDAGSAQEVEEAVAFTDVNYDFPSDDSTSIKTLIETVFPAAEASTIFGPDDGWTDNDCATETSNSLPFEIEGIVTIHPRWYFKTNACKDFWTDEKFYGSFFIQDGSGGIFVLGDSKVAHFDMGARVKMKVRGARTIYDEQDNPRFNMVYAHDITEIVTYGPEPIYYDEASGPFTDADIGIVKSVTGEVITEKGTFGLFKIRSASGDEYAVNIDAELSRRGFGFDIGTTVTVRGPVLFNRWDNGPEAFPISVIRSGQVTVQ